MGRVIDKAVEDVCQRLHEGRKPRDVRAMRPGWFLASIKTKMKQLREPDQSRSLNRQRTSEVSAEKETAVKEASHQSSSLALSRSTLWRALHDDLQARCFKTVRAPRTIELLQLRAAAHGRVFGLWQTAIEASEPDARV